MCKIQVDFPSLLLKQSSINFNFEMINRFLFNGFNIIEIFNIPDNIDSLISN
jgi:hypothetical protein